MFAVTVEAYLLGLANKTVEDSVQPIGVEMGLRIKSLELASVCWETYNEGALALY